MDLNGKYQLEVTLLNTKDLHIQQRVTLMRPSKQSQQTRIVRALNCGGGVHVAPNGVTYEKDVLYLNYNDAKEYSKKSFVAKKRLISTTETTQPIEGVDDQSLYSTCRVSDHNLPFHYVLPTLRQQGHYRVRLRFVELDQSRASRFHVTCNGAIMEMNIDVRDRCGGNCASPVSSELVFDVHVNSGVIVLGFGYNAVGEKCLRPQVAAIVVEEHCSGSQGSQGSQGSNDAEQLSLVPCTLSGLMDGQHVQFDKDVNCVSNGTALTVFIRHPNVRYRCFTFQLNSQHGILLQSSWLNNASDAVLSACHDPLNIGRAHV
jgi:hypothetical protein